MQRNCGAPRALACLVAVALSLAVVPAGAAPKAPAGAPPAVSPAPVFDVQRVAPEFKGLRAQDRIAVMPLNVELFSMSAGGVNEPRADWTAAAQQHLRQALGARGRSLGLELGFVDEREADDFAEAIALQSAVSSAIWLHHVNGGRWSLPTKQGRLDWSLGDCTEPLARHTASRYGLFVHVRDSHASPERIAAMVGLALLGVGLTGGAQVGHASLVDLDTGRVVWFNRLLRLRGDLRDAPAAAETVEELLAGLPVVR